MRPGPKCTVCTHPKRRRIEQAFRHGVSKTALARKYGVTRQAIWRHLELHPRSRGNPHTQCTVCLNLNAVSIVMRTAEGMSSYQVARKYGVSPDAVQRHWKHHVGARLKDILLLGPVVAARSWAWKPAPGAAPGAPATLADLEEWRAGADCAGPIPGPL